MQKKFRSSRYVWLIVALLGVLCLSGCGGVKLSEDFSKAELQAAAENTVHMLNSQDDEGIRKNCTAEMKVALTDEVFAQIHDALSEGGKFVSIEDVAISGAKNKDNGEEFAVVVLKAKYELKAFVYTISFTKQMKMAGLYYK